MPPEIPTPEKGNRAPDTRTGTTAKFSRLALQFYEAGHFGRAENIYAQICEQQPQDATAWYLRGINTAAAGGPTAATQFFIKAVNCDTENPQYCAALAEHLMRQQMDHAAVEPWQRTVDLAPTNAGYQFKFAQCLSRLGRHRDALPHFTEAVRCAPENGEYRIAYGVALSMADRHADAIAVLQRVAVSAAGDATSFFQLGFVCQRAEKFGDAAEAYQRAIEIDPALNEAHLNLAACLRDLGDLEGSIDRCRAVLERKPDSIGAMNNLGTALCALGHNVEAIIQYRNALQQDPENLTTLHNLGVALHAEGAFDEADKILRKCLIINPHFHDAQRSLANLLRSFGALAEAALLYQAVIDSRPLDFKSYGNLALVLLNLNKPHEAISVYEKALALEPNHPDLETGLGIAQLLTGDFPNGWANYEARLRMENSAKWRPDSGLPVWQGEKTKPGGDEPATVLIHAEQGFGDTLQFCRFIPGIQQSGVSVMFECQPQVAPVLESLKSENGGAPLQLTQPSSPLPDADYHIPLLSLPRIFETDLDTIPAAVPYLAPPADRKAKWAAAIPSDGAFSVGLVWEGNPHRQDDRLRSCPLDALDPIIAMRGIQLFGLQKDMQQKQHPTLHDLGPQLTDFADTAAVIERLDIVISVDTAVAHLAGALGRPVWVMLGFAADWRYLLDREDSPWYPTMRLFRQPAPGDWRSVTKRIAGELENIVAKRG